MVLSLFPFTGFSQLIISEFMADNDSVLQDEDGAYSDWIEIYNTTGSTIDLDGWHLTDNTNNLSLWTFPSTNIAAGGFVTVFASGKDRAFSGQELHTSFGLDSKGEYLALVLPNGTNIVSEFRDAFPKQFGDISYGYQTHGAPHMFRAGQPGYLVEHTPGLSNTSWPAQHPLYGDQSVGRIDIFISQADWFEIRNGTGQRNATLQYRQGDIDVTISNVALRPRGNTSYWKKPRSFQVSFNTYIPGQDLFDIEKLNLNSEVNDPTTARSKIINEMIQASGLPGAYANHTALVVHLTNGNNSVFFDSIHNNTMPVDDVMMEQQYGSSAANLYKCLYQQWPADLTYRGSSGSAYIGNGTTYELKYQGGADASYNDLAEFIDLINNTSAGDFPNEIMRRFEVDDYLKRMAINVLAGSWDDHWYLHNNYYLFDNPVRGKWTMQTFDFDNTLGIDWVGDNWGTKNVYNFGNNNPSVNPLIGRIFQVPELKNRYSYYMSEMLNTFYTSTGLAARAYQIRSTLTASLPFGSPSISNMKQTERNTYSTEDPYWSYIDFYNSYDAPAPHNVPDDYGLTPFFGARRASALSQLNVSNIAPVIADFRFQPSLPRVGEEIYIRAKVFDDTVTPLVDFWYEFDGGGYTNVAMTNTGGKWYELVLPAFTTNGTLTYYLLAIDDSGKVTYEPYGGSNYAYTVEIDSSSLNLAVTELNYHPYPPEGAELAVSGDLDQYEFIELRNTGSAALPLAGYELSGGIAHIFSSYSLAPGAFVLVVKNTAAFEARYGASHPVVGEYSGKLSDGGEEVRLLDPQGREIQVFIYSDGGSWPGRADGKGSSLEIINPAGDYMSSANWRSSSEYGGTPGTIGLGPDNRIVINEVLSHTDLPLVDSIELYNTTESAIDIGGWVLSDNSDNYRKYSIPNGTIIAAESYLVFDETNDFNKSMGISSNDFSLNSAHGDDVWLLEADTATNLLRFVDHVDFGAAKNGESYGRWPNGSGSLYPMESRTFGDANSGPRIGPVVISELMYHATNDNPDLEFVEIYNGSTQSVNLTNWELNKGVDYQFPSNHMLDAGSVVVVLPFDPDDPLNTTKLNAFLAYYSIDLTVDLLGPYSGSLNAAGETVELLRPDEPPAEEPTFIPMLLEDEVKYDDEAPWPTGPDGSGPSLTRIHFANWGNDPASWRGDLAGTPGNFIFSNAWLLTVAPSIGDPSPSAGSHVYGSGTIVTAQVSAVETQGLTRYVNTGWQMTGHDPSVGASQSFVFAITNSAELMWQWTTNHYLTVVSSAGGSVISTNGWYDNGSIETLQAVPAISNVFVQWTGDIGAIMSGSATSELIQITMNSPVNLTAVFADGFHDLTVGSEHGNPTPAAGLHSLPNGTTVNASVEPTIQAGEYQLACSGWLLSGAITGSGSSNAVSFPLTGDQSLTWIWVTNSWLDVQAELGGTVSGGGWQSLGATVELTASPDSGYGFFRWAGDTSAIVTGDEFSTNISVLVSSSLHLSAEFCSLVYSSNLLKNADFEIPGTTSTEAYHWEYSNPDVFGGASGSYARLDWESHGGGSWDATIRGTWAGAGTQGEWWQVIPAYPGVTYQVSGWFRTTSTPWSSGSQGMRLAFFDGGENLIGTITNPLSGLGDFWSSRSLQGNAPENTAWIRFSVFATDVGSGGAMQFDDLELVSTTCLNFPELMIEHNGTSENILLWESIGGASYTIQSSADLTAGFSALTNGISATPPLNVFTNPVAGSESTFYQLQLEAAQ